MDRHKVKKVAKFIVGWSSAFTVGNALRNNVNPKNTVQEVELVVGSIAVGAVVSEAAEEWTDRMVDKFFDALIQPQADTY